MLRRLLAPGGIALAFLLTTGIAFRDASAGLIIGADLLDASDLMLMRDVGGPFVQTAAVEADLAEARPEHPAPRLAHSQTLTGTLASLVGERSAETGTSYPLLTGVSAGDTLSTEASPASITLTVRTDLDTSFANDPASFSVSLIVASIQTSSLPIGTPYLDADFDTISSRDLLGASDTLAATACTYLGQGLVPNTLGSSGFSPCPVSAKPSGDGRFHLRPGMLPVSRPSRPSPR